jgi:metallophosphoesterase superfamily enzyme
MVYLEGLRLVDNQPALLLGEDVRTLVVADLHLGFEEELRGKGIRVPLQSHRLVDELCALAVEQVLAGLLWSATLSTT